MSDPISEIHDFWFGELDHRGLCIEDRHALWFGANPETDAHCRARFGAVLELALEGKLHAWSSDDRGLIALVLVLDQFSRNIHRGTPQAFGGDAQALELALQAIDDERHLRLPPIHRVFLYLPLEHCEQLAVQRHCVALFEALAVQTGEPQFEGFTRYAVAHRDVIERFGRFPHRNAILGRPSSDVELAWLEQHGGF